MFEVRKNQCNFFLKKFLNNFSKKLGANCKACGWKSTCLSLPETKKEKISTNMDLLNLVTPSIKKEKKASKLSSETSFSAPSVCSSVK